MKLDYKIESVPDAKDGYNVPAYTEGTLTVFVGDKLFFEARGVLLVEFAIVLHRWLDQVEHDGVVDLHYASMDFEEEPIFALVLDGNGDCFRPVAVWATGTPVPISVGDAKSAAASYISRLSSELAEKCSIDLLKVITDA